MFHINFKCQELLIILCCISDGLSTCMYEGKIYAEGESWNSSCDVCNCFSSAVSCTKAACPATLCQLGETLTHNPSECCPQCLPHKKPCNAGFVTFAHNDVWSSGSKCIFHQCQDGNVVPFVIQCPSLYCVKGEVPYTAPGECCPICSLTNCEEQKKDKINGLLSKCFLNTSTTESCNSKSILKENLLWKSPCTFCLSENTYIKCYSKKCPVCSSSTNNVDLCCPCTEDICDTDCLKCLNNDTSYCKQCRDPSKVLHNGKCLKECPKGFFEDEFKKCASCPPNCRSCFGNMSSQCTSCKSGFLLQKGRCVKTCDVYFYESNGYCFECHETCSSCIGPSEEDCIACILSGQLLQDGKCVDNCDGHFYVSDDGYCLSCNESCVRCLKNGSCQYCERGFYLQDGMCLPECYPGYYLFLDAYCLPCHEECQECFGPLPYQCSSCPFNQYLLKNSCVDACGQGYYGDLGAGLCRPCHPKCRNCLDTSSDDKCLSCSSGYLLPYIGTLFGPCVENCPDQYYLMDSGICGTCHETCETCFGPNETECLSCNKTLFYKSGACVPHCSTGYFEEDGVCYACHPSCSTCHGFTENDCYTCPHGRKLKYGKCVPICPDGKYSDLNGICTDCHSTCSDCFLSPSENKSIHCIKCKNQQYSIFKDECIPECSSVFYLNSHNTCTECHSSCATCERTGATSCASCWTGYFLTHLGTCEHSCHQGYYSSSGICEPCSSDCYECISATECIKCKGDLVLQFGKCVPSCPIHYYLDTVTRQCKECSDECRSCRGPLSSDCLSCYPGKLFEDGICVNHCSKEFFQEGNICKTCDLQCQTCSTLNTCTSCDSPYFLLKNECVDDCGAGYYPDYEDQSCKECSVGCISCASSDYCALCFSGYYLMNFECIRECPPGYFGEPLWRICQKNEDVPLLHANSILKIEPTQKILISALFLSAYDNDSDSLFITVSQLPNNGILLKMSEKGEEIPLRAGENFTYVELKDGWLFFKHLQGTPLKGDIAFKVTDGQLIGDELILPLVLSSKFPPVIEHIRNIILTEDSSIILNTSHFSVKDIDNLNDVTLQIVENPCSGKLNLLPDQKEIKIFTYKDFIQSKLVLKAFDKPVVHDDKFTIQISDGFNSIIAEIRFFILPKEQKELFLLRNNPLLVKIHEFTSLTNDSIFAISQQSLSSDIVFSLEKSSVASYGSFFKAANNSKKHKKITSAKISFSQKDIDDELIFYKHSDNLTTTVILPLKVTNVKSKIELNFSFEIKLVLHDENLVLPEETNQFGMMVLQNHPAAITSDHLQIQIDGISTDNIVYTITKKLAKEEGFLENLDKPGYKIHSFTQKDINDLKIIYHPPPYVETTETNYVFQFIILDSKRRVQLSPVQNFTITVRPQSTEFTSPSSSVDHVSTIVVPQGQSVVLGSHWLSTIGHQMPEDQLEVVLNIAPQHGNLTQMQNGYDIKIEEEDGFSFTSIIQDTFYIHDGSNNFKDYAVFKIMGGPYTSLNRIDFMISPNDKESPVILDSTSLMASVLEGDYLDLRRHHLAYTDLVSGDREIIFTLLNKPTSGNLTKLVEGIYITLQKGDTFTQQDINDKLIRFYARDPAGNNTIRENLYFDVSDGSGNVQPNQPLLMKVKPKIRVPPVVKVTSDVKVNEGGEAIIEPHVITVFDPDSPLSDLIAYIEQQPDYGFLENSRPIPGAEKSLAGIPISSFSYVDLVEGYIKYIQLTHRDVEPEKDTVYIRISDGFLSSPAHLMNITIRPMNDEVPLVYTQHLSVLQGSFTKVLNSSLSVTDGDTSPDQLYIRLESPPQKGSIRLMASNTYNLKKSKSLLKQDTFTFQDVLNGLIMYVHEDVGSHENDSFSFTVSDGHHDISGSIDVYIIVRDREVPYLERNLGLELLPGESSIIDNKILSALDSDSVVELLKYILTSDPSSGELFLMQNGKAEKISPHTKNTQRNYFTQSDINSGRLFYHHLIGNPVGLHYFRFNLMDPANNTLLDQKFFISIFEDLFPPVISLNTGLEVKEKGTACINSQMLAAVDEHQKDKNLIFSLTSLPTYGYLAMKTDIGKPITSFFMSDLNAGQVCYVHKSERHNFKDSFIFTVSDGKNYILQSFHINISFSSKALPFVKLYPLFLDEGTQKTITEFEIDIFDRDSADSELLITIISPPKHGKVIDSRNNTINQFTYEDIQHGHISYVHDDSDTDVDNFSVIITDGSSEGFVIRDNSGKNITTENPLVLLVRIFPIDDMYPVLLKHEGLQMLKKESERVWNILSEAVLFTDDADTEKEYILYRITVHPRYGSLELMSQPDIQIFQFTQKNIENQELVYVLRNDDLVATEDNFIFSVEDTKPNKLFNNIFKIQWTRIHFVSSIYNISETSGLIELPVKRTGNKQLDFTASCKIENVGPDRNHEYLIAIVDEINFKENDVTKFCIFRVIDNGAFEGTKELKIFLKSNISLLASPHTVKILINDAEDEPTLSFKEGIFMVNETDKYFEFPIIRQGDLNQEMSVLCNTSDITAIGTNASSLQTGSDYRSRDSSYSNFITFVPGVTEMMCTIKIIDDSLFEEEEEFLLMLSKPHPVGKILNHTLAHVIIQGPNDAPYVFIQDKKYEIFYGEQNSSVVILRQGVDISGTCTIWCWSHLLSHNKSAEIINSYYQITFEPFESSAICFVPTNSLKQKTQEIAETILISLDSPSGCLTGEPNKISVPLRKKHIYPIVEFKTNRMTVLENVGSINIPVQRTGDISSSATLHCITQDGTAVSREDFEERYKTRRNSMIHFSPEQKESFCSLNIYNDDKYEGNESFQLHLSLSEKENEMVTIGLQKYITIEIVDTDDVTVIELEKSRYLITQNSFPNSSVSAVISVVRHGDVSLLSSVRISTIDGSAASGLDYYAKSKILTFFPGEKKKTLEIEILYNKRRNWSLSFLVILGPDEVMNAEIGNISKAIVTIPRVESTESLILPSVPIVVSLIHLDDVKKGMGQDAKSGYPLICITPCDINYPDYFTTSVLCRISKINASSLNYSWEVAMPLNNEDNFSPFRKITDSTLFTSAYDKVLDSIYFRPHERVRCIVQPVDSQGHLGIPLRSQSVKISSESGFCQTSSQFQYIPASLASQPFIATLNYINSSDALHPNKLHIHIEIPHEDGLLPLLSTYPLHNIEFLLMHSVYRQQHVCSNLLHTIEKSFLKSIHPQLKDVRLAFPYHPEEISEEMQLIYQHLNLKQCKWSFDAWYSMSDLVELCGGSVTSDFKTKETDKTYVSVLLPFYVTYVFAAAPTGWTSVEHRTEIEFSFFYDTFLWKAGSYNDGALNGSLTVIRIGTDSSGHLFFEFKTVAKFYGCFVLEHHTLPGIRSHVTVPDGLNVKFSLQILWSEQSFDGPTQIWKATSNYNLKDYSGRYVIHLIPCEVTHTETFAVLTELHFLPCIAQAPQKFELPITFQQTLRPQPVTYALETFFQLFNDKNLFLMNPFEKHRDFQYIEYKGAFSKGEKVYGRVFWSPEQELESAYQLKINEVQLCTGKNGFVPLYDPTGKIYNKGPQYGCLLPNKKLQHKFTLLDRHHSDKQNGAFQALPFNAEFIEDSFEYEKLHQINGVDGFVFNIDPLHELSSSQQWFLQVTYSIKPIQTLRIRRSLENTEKLLMKENLTSMKMLLLKLEKYNSSLLQFKEEPRFETGFGAHHIMYLISGVLIVLGILIIGYRNPKSTIQISSKVFERYYRWMDFKTKNIDNRNSYNVVECKQKVKQTEKCTIKVTKIKDKVSNCLKNSSETEV